MLTTATDAVLYKLAERVGRRLLARHWRLALAESCTGGWIAKVITDVPGSSDWFERGFVTYSNTAKVDLLAVPPVLLDSHGAVSRETVNAMVVGALRHSRAEIAVAVSGIAGPTGGSPDKPVGTVWLAWAVQDRPGHSRCYTFPGDREAVRRQTVAAALQGVVELLDAG
ncbi:MAG: CinA family protein [Candidatus Competibacteraceae bacterium]